MGCGDGRDCSTGNCKECSGGGEDTDGLMW